MERDDPVPNHKHTLCLSVIILLSKDTFARDRCCAKMHNCSFYLRVQLLMPLVPGLNVQMQNSEVLIMSPCLKSRLFIRSHILEMYHGLVPEAGTEGRYIALERVTGDKEECVYPVERCTGELFFHSPQDWNGPAQNAHSCSIQYALIW